MPQPAPQHEHRAEQHQYPERHVRHLQVADIVEPGHHPEQVRHEHTIGEWLVGRDADELLDRRRLELLGELPVETGDEPGRAEVDDVHGPPPVGQRLPPARPVSGWRPPPGCGAGLP